MFNVFKKRKPENTLTDYSALHTDIHSHLIPGIDDGADSTETSLELIRELQALGFKKLITTPHVMADLYPNDRDTILKGLTGLRKAIKKAGLEIQIDAAAEYLMDERFPGLIRNEELLTLPGKRVLVEMPFISAPPGLHDNLFQLQAKGYKPILAHPERYLFLRGKMDEYLRLKEYGCEFQMNILSLTGYYGKSVRASAQKLLKNELIDFLGTDLHHRHHIRRLQKALKDRRVIKILTEKTFQNASL